jgi:hypothetical protein
LSLHCLHPIGLLVLPNIHQKCCCQRARHLFQLSDSYWSQLTSSNNGSEQDVCWSRQAGVQMSERNPQNRQKKVSNLARSPGEDASIAFPGGGIPWGTALIVGRPNSKHFFFFQLISLSDHNHLAMQNEPMTPYHVIQGIHQSRQLCF